MVSPDGRFYWDGWRWVPTPLQQVQTPPQREPVAPTTETSTPEQEVRSRSNWYIPAIAIGIIGGLLLGGPLLWQGWFDASGGQYGAPIAGGGVVAAWIGALLLAAMAVFAMMDNRAKTMRPSAPVR